MTSSYKELYGSSERQDDTTKKGLCWLELRRAGMVQWGESGQVESVDQHESLKCSSFVVNEEQNDEVVMAASRVSPQIRNRSPKHLQPKEARVPRRLKQKKTTIYKQIKHEDYIVGQKENSVSRKMDFIDRWSAERYKLAEKHMLEVMKTEGASFETPIPRSVLRMAARKYIPDTGLLDHLLKHIDGKVAPGGTERFRRCYNPEGTMEYWLESADLVKIKPANGVPNSNRVPLSCWIPGSAAVQQSGSIGELALLKEEMAKLKRDMDELSMKNKKQNQVNPVEEILKELMTWRNGTDQRLIEISSSLSGMQNMYRDLILWKSQIELKLIEFSNSVNSMLTPKQCSSILSPVSERWEDWLENTKLDNIQGNDFFPGIGSTDPFNVGQGALLQECAAPQPWSRPGNLFQEPNCARDLELRKDDIAQVNRDLQYLLPKGSEDTPASFTSDFSATKCDLENPFQEMVKWKVKMEERMRDIWNAISNLQASQEYTI